MKKLSNLAWIDLEMTGLTPDKDVILEIASIVTDKDLNIIAQGPNLVIHQDNLFLELMEEWVKNIHEKSNLLNEVKESKISLDQAKIQTLGFFQNYCFEGVTPLCGNSIWQDRRFLRKHMPELDNFFNYRIIDVTSIKEIVKRWYPDSPAINFEKKELHRALPDIIESIAELEHYKKNFFIK